MSLKMKAALATMSAHHIDATPERLAKASDGAAAYHGQEDGIIDRAGERPPLVRRFRDSHIDRMRLRGHITYAQWFAADWYRTIYAQAMSAPRVVAGYGEGVGGAGSVDYGTPRTPAQAAARKTLRQARAVIPSQMLMLVDRLVIEDEMPSLTGGGPRQRYAGRVAAALQPLAAWLRVEG